MSLSILPRVRVNYSALDLLKSMFVCDNSRKYTNACKSIIANFFDNEYVCLTPSCRDAIYELLIRLPQSKVLVPAYTCMVVNEAVNLAGKKIIYDKCDCNSFNSSYKSNIDRDTIVLATHQYGIACDIKQIAQRCKEKGAILIEDCATSFGTFIDGQMTGTFGDYAVISFNQSKLLNVPPFGGVLIGKDEDMLRRIERTAEWQVTVGSIWGGGNNLKFNGLRRGFAFVLAKNKYIYKFIHRLTIDRKGKLQRTEHELPSKTTTIYYKHKFTEWQASILLRQLLKIEHIFKKRKYIYAFYDKHINNPLIVKPAYYENAVCTRYAILVEDRYSFYKKCLAKGIDMDFSHCSIGCTSDFIEEHNLANKVLNLPFYYKMSQKEIQLVVDVINSIK